MLWMALLAVALAGEVVVALDSPVVVFVDGRLLNIEDGQAVGGQLTSGRHLVQVRNLLGQLVAEMSLEVPLDQQVRLRYGSRQLTLIGLGPVPVVTAATTPEPTAWIGPLADASATGSLEIVGFNSQTGSVWVDAVRVPYDAAADAFFAQGLAVGNHEVRIEKDRRVAYKGSLEVRAEQNQRCLLEARGREWVLDCFFERAPPMGTAAIVLPPALPPVVTAVTVEWVLKDPMDMCNVYVDGARVAEFRTGDRKRTVVLSAGVHTIEIRDFTEFETWHRGVLTVTGNDAIRVGFGEEEPVEVYNRIGAWQEQ